MGSAGDGFDTPALVDAEAVASRRQTGANGWTLLDVRGLDEVDLLLGSL